MLVGNAFFLFSLQFFSDKKVVVHKWQEGMGFTSMFYSPIAEFKYGVSKIKFIAHEHELIASSVDGSISIFNLEVRSPTQFNLGIFL